MFMTMLLGAWTILHIYVFWRASSIPSIVRYVPRKLLILIAAILWSGYFLRRFFDLRGWDSFAGPVDFFVMNWLGILFLVFLCLLIIDLITAFGFAFRHQVARLRSLGLMAGVVFSCVALFQGLRSPVVDGYEVRLAGLPVADDGLVIAAMSDLHLGRFIDGQWLAERVDQVKATRPDLVILLGDLFEGDNQSERQDSMIAILSGLSCRYGVWAVTGNHESHGGREAGIRFLEAAGIRVLANEWSEIHPGLAIGGVGDDGHHEEPAAAADPVGRVLAAIPRGRATIFLSHRPQMINEAASSGVGLMLSGHTHGGQIWPFSYVVGAMNPLLAGRYEVGGMSVIVSRGAGTWGPRMRLWQPGEIVFITLRSK